MNLLASFRPDEPVPAEYRAPFRHLYLDIAWFGIVAASSLSFNTVYAARLGASAFQVGLLSIGPALANLLLALPAGRWLERQPLGVAVFWTSVIHRFFYLLWALLPWMFGAQGQVWALIMLTMVMHVPGTALGVGFNALFAEAVPPRWRGHVAGVRNALLSVTVIAASLACGQILHRMPFPIGYQVVFGLGFLGAVMSSVHLWFLIPGPRPGQPRPRRSLRALVWPKLGPVLARGRQRLKHHDGSILGLVPGSEVLRGQFGRLVAVLFTLHLAFYLALPLFSLHWVNNLHLDDNEIGLGTALFYACVFVGSTQLAGLVRRMGNQRVTALGTALMAGYPAFGAAAEGLTLFLVASVFGGLGWSMVGGAVVNYTLEKVPEDNRAPYLAWYTLSVNGALLLGALVGPLVGNAIGLVAALAIFAGLRLAGAVLIWKWE